MLRSNDLKFQAAVFQADLQAPLSGTLLLDINIFQIRYNASSYRNKRPLLFAILENLLTVPA